MYIDANTLKELYILLILKLTISQSLRFLNYSLF